jgi:hypothetical protein
LRLVMAAVGPVATGCRQQALFQLLICIAPMGLCSVVFRNKEKPAQPVRSLPGAANTRNTNGEEEQEEMSWAGAADRKGLARKGTLSEYLVYERLRPQPALSPGEPLPRR